MLNAKIYFRQIVDEIILLIEQNIRYNAKFFSYKQTIQKITFTL